MKKSLFKKMASAALIALTVFACQSDDSAAVGESNSEAKIHFATDHNGDIQENVPTQILEIMAGDFQTNGDSKKLAMLTNTYDFNTGDLTEAALASEEYKVAKANEGQHRNSPGSYRAHIGGLGWMPWASYGQIIGTVGISARMEAIEFTDYPLVMQVGSAHVEDIGWMQASYFTLGTVGLGKRLEAVKTNFTGYHRAHVQQIGWMPWVKATEVTGTVGVDLRMEAYQMSQYNY